MSLENVLENVLDSEQLEELEPEPIQESSGSYSIAPSQMPKAYRMTFEPGRVFSLAIAYAYREEEEGEVLVIKGGKGEMQVVLGKYSRKVLRLECRPFGENLQELEEYARRLVEKANLFPVSGKRFSFLMTAKLLHLVGRDFDLSPDGIRVRANSALVDYYKTASPDQKEL